MNSVKLLIAMIILAAVLILILVNRACKKDVQPFEGWQ